MWVSIVQLNHLFSLLPGINLNPYIIFFFDSFPESDLLWNQYNIQVFSMIRKVILPFYLFLFLTLPLYGQSEDIERINESVRESDVKKQVYFLAADEFKGRETGTPQLDIAAQYIATWFMANNVKAFPGHDDYFQTIPFEKVTAPRNGELALGDSSFVFARDFVILNTHRGEYDGTMTVLDYGLDGELDGRDFDGNVVVVKAGGEGQMTPQQWFMSANQKNRELRERGAVAVIELYDSNQLPWQMIVNFLNQDRLTIADDEAETESIPHIWLNSTGVDLHDALHEMETDDALISIIGDEAEIITSSNVVGYIEGNDPELKDEYLILGAHYDHLGMDENRRNGNYIHNGARDNAVGTSAIMLAARYLAKHPPKRSVIFAAWTAEEIGLLGSNYFTENPMLPLEQIIYNLNIDGAGYNDTTKVTVIGLGRTEADDKLKEAAETFGLEAIPDPVPEQNLFDRSDNVNFARHGIPAPTYSLGITSFDEEINRYYHTIEDEPHTINYSYVTQYIRSFLLAAQKVANADAAPFWIEGDVYEEAGKELYGRD